MRVSTVLLLAAVACFASVQANSGWVKTETESCLAVAQKYCSGFAETIVSETPELAAFLSDTETPALTTVFCPNNAALPQAIVPESVSIKDVLYYHVVGDAKILSKDLVAASPIPTILGRNLTVKLDGDGKTFIVEADRTYAYVLQADYPCSAGVLHVIDFVLIPSVDSYKPVSPPNKNCDSPPPPCKVSSPPPCKVGESHPPPSCTWWDKPSSPPPPASTGCHGHDCHKASPPPVNVASPPCWWKKTPPPPVSVSSPPAECHDCHKMSPPPCRYHDSPPPPVKVNSPPVCHSPPPVCHSPPPPVKVNSPPVCHSPPPVCHSPPPPVKVNSPPVCHSPPPVCHSPPPVCHSPPPPVKVNSPPVCHSPPPVCHSPPPVCHSPPPPVKVNSPPVCHSPPPVCHSPPPMCDSPPPPVCASPPPPCETCTTIYEYICSDPNLSVLKMLIDMSGLAPLFQDRYTLVTFLAPTNQAFQECGVAGLVANKDNLIKTLKNHIIPGVQATKEKLKDGMCLASYHEEKHLCMACQGDNVEVKPTGTSICAKIVWPFNIKACESIVHTINVVLVPAW